MDLKVSKVGNPKWYVKVKPNTLSFIKEQNIIGGHCSDHLSFVSLSSRNMMQPKYIYFSKSSHPPFFANKNMYT